MDAQYRFRFSEDHLLTSFLRYRQQVWWRRAFLGLKWFLAIPFALALALAVYAGSKGLAALFGGIFGAVLGALLLGWRIDAWLIRKRFRKSPFHNDEIAFAMSESGSHVVGRDSEVRVGWTKFTRARRFEDGLLLFQGPGYFNWLPDAAAVDATTVENAQRLARTHVQDYRDV
jgi:hypothetical protein